MKNIAVFCGSSPGTDEKYMRIAREVGSLVAQQGLGLVYGGASVGLMGAVADGALAHDGVVIGVLPKFMNKIEIAHDSLTEFILVETMHQRKTIMSDRADGIIALPGGFGTLEELFEILTWGQLGLHEKPVAVLNVEGFYDDLLSLLDTMLNKGFLTRSNRDMLLVSDNPVDLLEKMRRYRPPSEGKWIVED